MNSVEKFNSLNGKNISRENLSKLSTQAFDEQQFEVMERLNKLLETHPEAEFFDLEIETPAKFNEKAHGGMAKPSVKKIKEVVTKTKKRIVKKLQRAGVKAGSGQNYNTEYFASLGMPVTPSMKGFLGCMDFQDETDDLQALGKVSPQDIYKMITDKLVKSFKEKDTHKYKQKWKSKEYGKGYLIPFNFVTKKRYRGINYAMLSSFEPMENPFYLSFKQIEKLGGKLKKGSRGNEVVYYTNLYKIVDKAKNIDFATYELEKAKQFLIDNNLKTKIGRIPMIRYYNVFNGKDIEGIDFKLDNFKVGFIDNPLKEGEKNEIAESIISNYPDPKPKYGFGGGRAFYSPAKDAIQMPHIIDFETPEDYYRTFLHELGHSTGSENRLNRDFSGKFGSKKYAQEELIAEWASVFLSAEAGIIWHSNTNHVAYMKSWNAALTHIKEDTKFLIKAASEAQKIADFVLQFNENGEPKYFSSLKKVNASAKKDLSKNDKTISTKHDTNYQLILFSDYKSGTNKFGITDADGNPLWYGVDFDQPSSQPEGELNAAKKAIWLAYKIVDLYGQKGVKLILNVDAQWLVYQDNPKQKGYQLKKLADKYGIELDTNWIPGKDNPADEYTVKSGFMKWSDTPSNRLFKLLKPLKTGLGMPCVNLTKAEISKAAEESTDRVRKMSRYAFSNMPDAAIDEIKSWKVISKSPYSHSYYNDICKSWDYTAENSYRISDHWNFVSRGETHAKTDKKVKNGNWVMAQYKNGIYHVIKDYGVATGIEIAFRNFEHDKEYAIRQISNDIQSQKRLEEMYLEFLKIGINTQDYELIKKNGVINLAQVKKFDVLVQEKFIKKYKPIVVVEKGIYSGSGRRIKRVGSEKFEGKLINLTNEFATIDTGKEIITGREFEFKNNTLQWKIQSLTGNKALEINKLFDVLRIKNAKKEFADIGLKSPIKSLGTVYVGTPEPTQTQQTPQMPIAPLQPVNNEVEDVEAVNEVATERPVKPQPKNKLMSMKFETIPMDEGWEEFMQHPAANMKVAIWGKPKNGKTSGALKLAKYLSKKGSLLYNFVDQGFNFSTQELWKQSGLADVPHAEPSDIDNLDALEVEIKRGKYKFVFIDMINDYINKQGISPQEFKDRFIKGFPNTSFILIFEVTKGGDFKGDQGWTHIVDAMVTVENFLMEARGRYGHGHHVIWEEGLKKYDPKKYDELFPETNNIPSEVVIM
ncbi:MAG: ArdC family protein [Flavobacteriales bacterium]